jgi:hypothetical protein
VFLHRGFLFSVRCAALADAAHEHCYLLHYIAARQSDGGDDDILKAHGIPAGVADKVHMIITVVPTGASIFT